MIESRFTKLIKVTGGALAFAVLIAVSVFSPSPLNVVAARAPATNVAWQSVRASGAITYTYFLPLTNKYTPCAGATGETYNSVAVISPPTNPPAEIHPDLNLAMRGYISTTAYLGLVNYGGVSDLNAPQLYGLFSDQRTGVFHAAYQVYNWDWANNRRGGVITDYPVTLAGLAVTPTEIIHVPTSGYDIGRQPTGYAVMVLYASENRITLKYTREDNVILGYTIHLENICVDQNLLTLYRSLNAAGRARLPALFAGQGVGRALTNELGVAIRDTGAFMDPRSRNDWWIGR